MAANCNGKKGAQDEKSAGHPHAIGNRDGPRGKGAGLFARMGAVGGKIKQVVQHINA